MAQVLGNQDTILGKRLGGPGGNGGDESDSDHENGGKKTAKKTDDSYESPLPSKRKRRASKSPSNKRWAD